MTHVRRASRFALTFATHSVTWQTWLPRIPGTLIQRVWGGGAALIYFYPVPC